jgi:hypothetical protein
LAREKRRLETAEADAGLERAIAGALRAAIHDHGSITPEHVGSAVKRIVGNLRNLATPITEVPRRAAGRRAR